METKHLLIACVISLASCRVDKWDKYESMVKSMEQNPMLEEAWNEAHYPKFKKGQIQAIPEGQLTCFKFPPSAITPTSVHALRPSDVDVVAAIGDSLTAANGALASTALGLLTEYRGRSFSMGGDKDASSVVTMPNILRTHVTDLEGHSTGTGKKGSKDARLNFAVPGSTAQELPQQAHDLVDALRQDPAVDFHSDWKVITVFVGGNDVCDYFDGEKDENTPDKYIEAIGKAIDIFHAAVPRVFVNLVEVLDLSMLPDLSKGFICPLLHRYLCKHVASGQSNAAVSQLVNDYNRKISELVKSGKYETRDDFTVVIQPFFRNTTYPRQSDGEPDWTFFAPDCFHFSAKGHAAAGEALWNNMMQPVGQKSTSWSPDGQHVFCPSDDTPYLATYKNSHGGFAAFAAISEIPTTSTSDDLIYWFGGTVAAVAFIVIVVAIIVAVIVKKSKRKLGESLENLPQAIEAGANKKETRLNVPLSVSNELYLELNNHSET